MGALSSLATVGLNLALAQQGAKRRDKDVKAERDRQIQAIRARDDEERRRRREALRRRLAAERARAGAAGVGGPGGSSQAVLRGLLEESDDVQQASDAASARRIGDLRNRASAARRRNRLDLAGSVARGSFGPGGRGGGSSLLNF